MTTLTTKHQRLAALRPLYPESVASLTAASDVRRVYESNSIEGKSLTLRETELVLSKALAEAAQQAGASAQQPDVEPAEESASNEPKQAKGKVVDAEVVD